MPRDGKSLAYTCKSFTSPNSTMCITWNDDELFCISSSKSSAESYRVPKVVFYLDFFIFLYMFHEFSIQDNLIVSLLTFKQKFFFYCWNKFFKKLLVIYTKN